MEDFNSADLDFTKPDGLTRELIPGFGGLTRQDVDEFANMSTINGWNVDSFTLDEVDLMMERPNLYTGKIIPNKNELILIARTLRARKAVLQ